MKYAVMKKWVKALRSDDYLQGVGRLRNDDYEYCCLGVLCDLYRKEKHKGWNESLSDGGTNVVPADKVAEWAGMSRPNPAVPGTGLSLARLNDAGHCFAYIADLIEANYKSL